MNIESRVKQFCDESTMHGFHEVWYARSFPLKFFWFAIIVVGCSMTVYQVHQVVCDYRKNPTKTQIALLSSETEMVMPPAYVCFSHWSDWMNFTRVVEFGFDLDTLLYVIAHIDEIDLAGCNINVSYARKNTVSIMQKNKFESMYDLLIALSTSEPYRVQKLSFNIMNKFFYNTEISGLSMCYTGDNGFIENTQSAQLILIDYDKFEDSAIHELFMQVFNFSLNETYRRTRGDSKMPSIFINPTGNNASLSFQPIIPRAGFTKILLKPTVYKWIPTPSFSCNASTEFRFYTTCWGRCQENFKIVVSRGFCPLSSSNETDSIRACSIDDPFYDRNETNMRNIALKFLTCLEDCQRSCDQWVYESTMQISNNEIKKVNAVRNINKTLNKHAKGADEANVNLSNEQVVSDKSYRYETHIWISYQGRENVLVISVLPAYTWDDVLANIGGLMGLWLGGSILSFIQIVYFFCCVPIEEAYNRNFGRNLSAMHKVKCVEVKKSEMNRNSNGADRQ